MLLQSSRCFESLFNVIVLEDCRSPAYILRCWESQNFAIVAMHLFLYSGDLRMHVLPYGELCQNENKCLMLCSFSFYSTILSALLLLLLVPLLSLLLLLPHSSNRECQNSYLVSLRCRFPPCNSDFFQRIPRICKERCSNLTRCLEASGGGVRGDGRKVLGMTFLQVEFVFSSRLSRIQSNPVRLRCNPSFFHLCASRIPQLIRPFLLCCLHG